MPRPTSYSGIRSPGSRYAADHDPAVSDGAQEQIEAFADAFDAGTEEQGPYGKAVPGPFFQICGNIAEDAGALIERIRSRP
jgi:hypothetical protein